MGMTLLVVSVQSFPESLSQHVFLFFGCPSVTSGELLELGVMSTRILSFIFMISWKIHHVSIDLICSTWDFRGVQTFFLLTPGRVPLPHFFCQKVVEVDDGLARPLRQHGTSQFVEVVPKVLCFSSLEPAA